MSWCTWRTTSLQVLQMLVQKGSSVLWSICHYWFKNKPWIDCQNNKQNTCTKFAKCLCLHRGYGGTHVLKYFLLRLMLRNSVSLSEHPKPPTPTSEPKNQDLVHHLGLMIWAWISHHTSAYSYAHALPKWAEHSSKFQMIMCIYLLVVKQPRYSTTVIYYIGL